MSNPIETVTISLERYEDMKGRLESLEEFYATIKRSSTRTDHHPTNGTIEIYKVNQDRVIRALQEVDHQEKYREYMKRGGRP